MFQLETNQESTDVYYATMRDEARQLVPGSALVSLELWLYDLKSGAIINGRGEIGGPGQDVLGVGTPTGGVTVYNALQSVVIEGVTKRFNLRWQVSAADNVIASARTKLDALEEHRAVFRARCATGSPELTHSIAIFVKNLKVMG